MKLTGYWVSKSGEAFTLTQVAFDETELDPITGWQEAYQNEDPLVTERGFIQLKATVAYVRGNLPSTIIGDESPLGPQFNNGVLVLRSKREVDQFLKGVLPIAG